MISSQPGVSRRIFSAITVFSDTLAVVDSALELVDLHATMASSAELSSVVHCFPQHAFLSLGSDGPEQPDAPTARGIARSACVARSGSQRQRPDAAARSCPMSRHSDTFTGFEKGLLTKTARVAAGPDRSFLFSLVCASPRAVRASGASRPFDDIIGFAARRRRTVIECAMVNRNLIRSLENDPELKAVFQAALEDATDTIVTEIETEGDFDVNKIVEGRIVRVDGDSVLVDVGFKSEGTISADEWDEDEEPPEVGETIQVLIEEVEDELGMADDPARHGSAQQAQGREDPAVGNDDEDRAGGPGRHRHGHAQDQGWFAGRYRRQRVPAGQPGGYSPPGRHRRLHRPRRAVRSAEDRRSAAQYRGQPPLADREAARGRSRTAAAANWKSASCARASSRTSPTSARSSTWAASTACCTSPT